MMVQPLFLYHGATDSPSLAPLARHSDALGFGRVGSGVWVRVRGFGRGGSRWRWRGGACRREGVGIRRHCSKPRGAFPA